MRYDVQVGYESRLEDDGNVRSVEEFDWITALLASVTSRLDGEINTESLKRSKSIITIYYCNTKQTNIFLTKKTYIADKLNDKFRKKQQ